MDFIEGFPCVGGKSVILTMVNRFSKYAHFIPLGHLYTVVSVAKAFFNNIVKLHGIPCSIISDRDPVFTSTFWTELFCLSGVQLRMSMTFHPQTDGQSEVTNRIVGVYLRCLVGVQPPSWLPWAEYCYNTSFQTTLRVTPFQVVYGRDPPSLLSYEGGQSKVPTVDQQLVERDGFLVEIKDRLHHVQELMKGNYDQHHCELTFEEGDWVWLRLHHRLAATLTNKARGKLAPKFYGPFQVLACIGIVAYRLALPPKCRIHDVFHVVFLKKFTGTPSAAMPGLPPIKHGRVLLQPEKVLRAHLNRGMWEILVQWMDQAAADATWEKVPEFKDAYPSF
jgi:hypothetical protein